MSIDEIMEEVQKADIKLSGMSVEESYDFAIDMNNNLLDIAKYQLLYYEKSEKEGLTYQEATDRLGEYLRNNLQENVIKVDSV